MLPAIIISSHSAGLAATRALGRMGVPVVSAYYDTHDMGYVSKYASERVLVPHPERQEQQFVRKLVECYDRFGQALLVPADDATLLVVSRHKAQLSNYFLVACTEYGITERFIDKKHTYALAHELGVAAPWTRMPASFEELAQLAGTVEYPCLVKPCHSHRYYELFRRKMVKVSDADQLRNAYQEAKSAGLEVMVQEYIPGDDSQGVNYNSYFWDGQPLLEFTAAKVRLDPPAFGVPSVVVSKEVSEVLAPGRKFLQGLGFYGFSCMEFKKDCRDGSYKLMEVNGRHNRSALLAVCCGINFPWLEYRHLVQGAKPSARSFRQGIYWIDEFRDLDRYIATVRRERLGIAGYLAPYLKRHVFAVFDWGDLKPFWKHCHDLLTRLWRQLLGKMEPDAPKRGHSYEK